LPGERDRRISVGRCPVGAELLHRVWVIAHRLGDGQHVGRTLDRRLCNVRLR